MFLANDAPEMLESFDNGEEIADIIRRKLDITIVIDARHREVSVVAGDSGLPKML